MESTEKQISLDAGFHVPYSSDKGPEPTHTPGNVTAVDANGNSDQVPVNREAQAGVKGFQATATVWTEAHLILEYVIREAHNELALLKFYPTNSVGVKYLVYLSCYLHPGGCHPFPQPLCDKCLYASFSDRCHEHHGQHYRWFEQNPLGKDFRLVGSTTRHDSDAGDFGCGLRDDGGLRQLSDLRSCASFFFCGV